MHKLQGRLVIARRVRLTRLFLTVILVLSCPVLLFASPVFALSPDTDLSAVDASFIGENNDDNTGYRVASAGDVNGDGFDDILIGSPGGDDGGTNAGKVYLVLGKASGWGMDTDISLADASFTGVESDDNAGLAVASAGDVNGDGYDDILIGALYNDDNGTDAGKVYLVLGKASGWARDISLSTADASFSGEDGGDMAGISVASAGDVNGDGYDDILVGAVGDNSTGDMAGKAYLMMGKESGWVRDVSLSTAEASFTGEDGGDMAGISVASAGDVNGDGFDDILVGAYRNGDGGSEAGQTYLILGKYAGWVKNAVLSTADASFIGENNYDNSGISVSSAGDVNGDGYDDILVGANQNGESGSNAGQIYLVLGKASGWAMRTDLSAADASFTGENINDMAGVSVATAGDVNGDGYDDILIGAHKNSDGGSEAGKTYLILGMASGWVMDTGLSAADASFTGETVENESGYSAVSAGDVNGDGGADILIGAWNNNDGGVGAGQAYLILSDYPIITSCNAAGFKTENFGPGQTVYVKGINLNNGSYKVWIQNNPVVENDTLVPGEDPSGSRESIIVSGGSLEVTAAWDIGYESEATFTGYDIVLDNQGTGSVGTYNNATDYLDSMGIAGFVAPVPEAASLALAGAGMAVIAGYWWYRRLRRSAA